MHSILLSQVTFLYPGHDPVLNNITTNITGGIVALVGPNGAGKTTLMRLMMRELEPAEGRIGWRGFSEFGWLPQDAGTTGNFSTGEAKWRRLMALLREANVLFLDEPETHLDTQHRNRLAEILSARHGLTLLASHDAALLNLADTTLHIENGTVTAYSMSFAEYAAARAAEKVRREKAVVDARRSLKKAERERQTQLERQLRRSRNAARRAPDAGIPKIMQGMMKRNAEKTLGKMVKQNREREAKNREELMALRRATGSHTYFGFEITPADTHGRARIELQNVQLLLRDSAPLWQKPLSFAAKPAEPVQITGDNGSGKSMLLKAILGKAELAHRGEIIRGPGEIRLIDAAHTGVDIEATPLDLARSEEIAADNGEIRRLLGAYGFPGEGALRPFAALSAGEKIRLRLFLAAKSPRPCPFFFSDEAETGLDLATRETYAEFLRNFPGIALIVSHDGAFTAAVGARQRVCLTLRHS